MLLPQLPAGGINIRTPLNPLRNLDACTAQDFAESADASRRRAVEAESMDGVVRNQVHMAVQPV